MTLRELASKLVDGPLKRQLLKGAAEALRKRSTLHVYSLAGSAPAVMLAALDEPDMAPVVVVGDSPDDAGYLYHDLSRVCGSENQVAMFPSGYKRHIKYGQADPPSQILRTETLAALNHPDPASRPRFIVTYPDALAEKVASQADIDSGTLRLAVNTKLEDGQDSLIDWLYANGFTETDYVYEPGQFARRGSIVDVFGFSHELPFRIDFFGSEIDSLRTFSTETQLSVEIMKQIDITANVAPGKGALTSLLDTLPDNTLLAARSPEFVTERVAEIASESFSESALLAEDSDAHSMEQVVDPEAFAARWHSFGLLHFTAAKAPEENAPRGAITFDCSPQALYHKNFDLIADSFSKFLADGYRIYILSDSEKQHRRLADIFADRGDRVSFTPVVPTLHAGFVDHRLKVCVFTDHQVFDRFHKYSLRSDKARSGKIALSLKELQAIEPGDYIVHVDHGVGRFAGLLRTDVNGKPQEMIKLVYANDDIIFVSIHSLHKLAKYRGKEGVPPKVNKLGSGAWNRAKEKTKSRLKDIARDLIKLYAARKEQKGHAFAPDTYLQHELEASFAYEDTPDQLKATQEVKKDMESEKPMDRLVCGDVGFGKTEIAIRAAFKAAVDGKQTAVLVPTTVLAYQHFNTFSQRLQEFPVRVEYLSRARSAKQTREILADLAAGKIDILIGTHKLIGKSVKFKDLGLLIVDEEQKFGVAVKEKLKQLKTSVDTLTMSATPIPRTLQFSLMGARDLSAITTPPANRRPIVTSVTALNDSIVAEAINFELARNGQVFIVNNRIEGLYDLEAMVKRLVPDARVAVGHGQMPPEKLEQIINDFAAHDFDVLIATTIIESGVDMPNVNTMIINNAQNFGLSELHQLRGRVGRSDRKAFCYLMVPPAVPLSPVARRRLQAIESFADLGSGIHIAMQDLDIRGAGNLLGAEQSGFIADLGYETYQKILKEAVTELRTEEFPDLDNQAKSADQEEFVADTVIESDLELLLPPWYVPGDSERVALYQELDGLDRESDLLEFRTRLEDRFGKLPPQTAELLRVPRLRRLGRQLGVEKISLKGGVMYLYFVGQENQAYYQSPMFGRMVTFLQTNPSRVRIRENNSRRSFAVSHVETVEEAVDLLTRITELPVA